MYPGEKALCHHAGPSDLIAWILVQSEDEEESGLQMHALYKLVTGERVAHKPLVGYQVYLQW